MIKNGGERGIRTLGNALRYTRFPVVHLRPLGHLSTLKTTGNGGEGGIRTHGDHKATTVFETAPFDHSGTSPASEAFSKPPLAFAWLQSA